MGCLPLVPFPLDTVTISGPERGCSISLGSRVKIIQNKATAQQYWGEKEPFVFFRCWELRGHLFLQHTQAHPNAGTNNLEYEDSQRRKPCRQVHSHKNILTANQGLDSPVSSDGMSTKVLLVMLYLVSKTGSKTSIKMIRNITKFSNTRNRKKEK